MGLVHSHLLEMCGTPWVISGQRRKVILLSFFADFGDISVAVQVRLGAGGGAWVSKMWWLFSVPKKKGFPPGDMK